MAIEKEPPKLPDSDHLRVVWIAPPTREEADAANAGAYAPQGATRWLYDFTHSVAARLGLATATVAGGAAAYVAVPAVHEFVDSRINDIRQKITGELSVPNAFNNSAKEGIIGVNNTTALSLEEIQKLFPEQMVESDTSLKFLFPFVVPEGSRIKYARMATPEGVHLDPKTGAEIRQERDWSKRVVRDNATFSLPKDTILINPAFAHVTVGNIEDQSKLTNEPNRTGGARIFFYDSSSDITYQFWIFPIGELGVRAPFEPLQPLQERRQDKDTGWKDLPVIQAGEPLLRLTRDLTVKINVTAYHGDRVGATGQSSSYSLSPDFITDRGKLVVLEK